MIVRTQNCVSQRPLPSAAALALVILATGAATWLWAHAGHDALPTEGVTGPNAQGQLILGPKNRAALQVQTARVRPQSLEEKLVAPATVVAPWTGHAFVTTRLAGKVMKVHVQPGQAVTRGQCVAEVASLELETLQLELLDARNEARLSAQNLERLEPAYRRGSISGKTYAEAQFQHRQTLNAQEMARLKLLGLGVADDALEQLLRAADPRPLATLPIQSPLTGVVIHVDVGVGQVVEPTQHLLEVVDLSRVWVKIGVLEKDLHEVKTGQNVDLRFTGFAREVFVTRVRVKGSCLDPKTHLGTVWAELTDPRRRVLPGMFGRAEIRLPATEAGLLIPASALISAGAERYVLIEEGPGQYRRQNVVVQRQGGGLVQVARNGGLFAGDRVVTTGSHELAASYVQGVLRLSPEAERNIGLRVEPARRHPVAEVVQLRGAVDLPPASRAIVSARLAGTIARINVDLDQVVGAGEVVAEVASLELQNLQLDLLRSHLQYELLDQKLQFLRPLAGKGVVPDRTLRETESALTAARQRRDSLARKLRSVGLSAEQIRRVLAKHQFAAAFPVRATVPGTVVRFQAVLGQAIKAEDALFEVHNLAGAGLRVYVSERQLPQVSVGQRGRVRLVADPGFVGQAVVERTGPTVGVEDRTLSVWATLPGPPRTAWRQGMLARLTLVVSEPGATLAVPREAVLREGTQAYLFVRRDGIFERRPVVTGRGDDVFLEILQGLQAGDQVAVRGVAALQTAYSSLK